MKSLTRRPLGTATVYYRAAMLRQSFGDLEARHHLLEGFLLRLSRRPEAEAFALRGGMLVRHWFPAAGRPARDVDLVCALPYDVESIRSLLRSILADDRVADGVVFDSDVFRLDALHPNSAQPGLRLFAAGRADARLSEMSVDLTFHLEVWPSAQRAALELACGVATLWTCRPEMLIGRKLQVTEELGPQQWRPKDLGDLWLMSGALDARSMRRLEEAIARSLTSPAELIGHPSWWSAPHAAARWRRFSRGLPAFPRDLGAVVESLQRRLAGIARIP